MTLVDQDEKWENISNLKNLRQNLNKQILKSVKLGTLRYGKVMPSGSFRESIFEWKQKIWIKQKKE